MDVRDRVRVTLLVGLVVLFVGVVVFDLFKTEIWVAVQARRLWDEDPAVRDEAASALLRQGARGQAALERVAFSRKIAEPGTRETAARQAAMNVLLWRDFCWGSNLGNVPLITRYLREGRGLERLKVFDALEWVQSRDPGLIDAASEVVLTDPAPLWMWTALRYVRWYAPESLRRAPLESVNVRTRLMIIGDLVRRRGEERTWILPEDEKILRLLLADRDECIRVAAAAFLADADRDPVGFPILVAYLRQPIAQIFERELWCWLWGPVTQAFSRLNDDRAAWALGRARAYFGTLDERGLDESPRISPAEWESWWREHASEYPPQVDPDRIAVGPLTSSSSVSLPLLR